MALDHLFLCRARLDYPYRASGYSRVPVLDSGKEGAGAALALVHQHLGTNYGLPAEKEKVESASFFRLFSPELWRNTLTSCTFFLCQVLPFFAISIFLPVVVKGLNIANPHASGMLYNGFTMVGVIIGILIADKISRRAFLLWTFYGAAAVLTLMTVWQNMPALWLLSCWHILYRSRHLHRCRVAVSAGTLPTELRGSGVGLTIAFSRIGAGMGTWMLPVVTEQYGVTVTLGCCIASLVIGGVVCQALAPETSPKFAGRKSSSGASVEHAGA